MDSQNRLLFNVNNLHKYSEQLDDHCRILRAVSNEVDRCRQMDSDYYSSRKYSEVLEKIDRVINCLRELSFASEDICEDVATVSKRVSSLLDEFMTEASKRSF